MAFGARDARGIYQFGEDDAESTFSALLNIGMDSVSDATKYFSGTPAQRALLTPAPDGGVWVDTDTAGRIWRGIGGAWVQMYVGSGAQSFTSTKSIPNAALSDIGTVPDIPGFCTGSTNGTITFTSAGIYAVSWSSEIGAVTNGRTFVQLAGNRVSLPPSVEDRVYMGIPTMEIDAGASLQFTLFQTSGAARTVTNRVMIERRG